MLVGAMRLQPTLALDSLPRMADFARWGGAAAVAMGCGVEPFMAALSRSVERQTDEALESDELACAVRELA